MKRFKAMLKLAAIRMARKIGGKPGDWAEATIRDEVKKAVHGRAIPGYVYDPEEEQAKEASETPSAFKTFWDKYSKGEATISDGTLMLAKFNEAGKIADYKLVKLGKVKREARASLTESVTKGHITEAAARCIEDYFSQDDYAYNSGIYDQNNYTEYVPLLGGPFFRQMYLTDMLAGHQKSFEALNHNPLARRLIRIIKQYALARGYKVQSKDSKAVDIWTAFEKKFKVNKKVRKGWSTDYLTFGEFFLDKEKITSIDPSTIWDIITDPEDIDNVYYYYQSFPTAFQQFTGFDVPGVPGSQKVPSVEYVIRQIPFDRVFHLKSDVTSAEKRGRPALYPVLSWLKRFKDYWNAELVRAWVQASYNYDITVKGSPDDVSAIAGSSDVKKVPAIGSSYVHNEAVTRQVLSPAGSSSGRLPLSEELIAIISACLGIPKETLNAAAGTGGGGRATALVSSEPFTKVIEELQSDITELLQELARIAFKLEGKEYNDELEFIFPSTVKDSTTETIRNIQAGETSKYISHKRAATMYAAEMDITIYDYDGEMEEIKEEQEHALDLGLGDMSTAPAAGGGFGDDINGDDDIDPNPTKGQAKIDIKKDMNRL